MTTEAICKHCRKTWANHGEDIYKHSLWCTHATLSSFEPEDSEEKLQQELPCNWIYRHATHDYMVLLRDLVALIPKLEPEQSNELALAFPAEALLSALCALEGQQRENLLGELRWNDRGGKYFQKARVYGAIACHYRNVLKELVPTNALADEAIKWRDNHEGVPPSELDAFERILMADAESACLKDQVRRLREALTVLTDEALPVLRIAGHATAWNAHADAAALLKETAE